MPILKQMDDREVVKQYVEVFPDQETHTETPEAEHRSLGLEVSIFYIGSMLRSTPMNSGGLGLGADQIAEPEDE